MAMHLTPLDRESISHWLRDNVAKAEIARRLGRHRKTIFNELKRDSIPRSYGGHRRYCAVLAQKMDCPVIREYVEKRVKDFWSPDQVSHRIRVDFPHDHRRPFIELPAKRS